MPALSVRSRVVGPWPMNAYALVCPQTGASALIDPGADPDALTELLLGTAPACIVLTHTHPDHVGALDEMRERLGVPLIAHGGPHGLPLVLDRELHAGDRLTVGAGSLRVYETPGHIADQICLQDEGGETIIVGDTLFAGGPGRTWTPADFQTTLRTLREVVLAWPDGSLCYPGHGPSFRLGELRPHIETFLARKHDPNFAGDAEW